MSCSPIIHYLNTSGFLECVPDAGNAKINNTVLQPRSCRQVDLLQVRTERTGDVGKGGPGALSRIKGEQLVSREGLQCTVSVCEGLFHHYCLPLLTSSVL